MKHKKIMTLGLIGIASVLTLTACSENESENKNENKSKSEEVKKEMYSFIKKYDDRELKEISFDTNPKDTSKKYILTLETPEGSQLIIYDNDDVPDKYVTLYGIDILEQGFKDILKEKTGYEYGIDEKVLGSSKNISPSTYLLDTADILKEAKENNLSFREYFNKNKEDVIKKYTVYDLIFLFTEGLNELNRLSQKEKDTLYDVYTDVFKNVSKLSIFSTYIQVVEQDSEFYIELFGKDDKGNPTELTKEEFMQRLNNPSDFMEEQGATLAE